MDCWRLSLAITINQATTYISMEDSYELVITVNVTCMMVLASIYLSISDRCPICNHNCELFSLSKSIFFVHFYQPPSFNNHHDH